MRNSATVILILQKRRLSTEMLNNLHKVTQTASIQVQTTWPQIIMKPTLEGKYTSWGVSHGGKKR